MERVYGHFNRTSRCEGGWVYGPVIIGGLSDSGTRGAKYIAKDMLNITFQTSSVEPSGDDALMNAVIGSFWRNFEGNASNVHITEESYYKFEQIAQTLCGSVKEDWQ